VRAVAHVQIPHGTDSRNGPVYILTTLKSPGVWGIEDDSGEDYFNEVFKEEQRILYEMLNSLREYEVTK
jgi:hypothetical protein